MRTLGFFRWPRGIWRFLLLIGTSLQSSFEFASHRLHGPVSLAHRAEWLHRSCVRAVNRLGITLDINAPIPNRGLLVSNHLSYVDVLALGAIVPCVFVAKRQVQSWPLFGRLARFGATIFVDRDGPSDAARATKQIAEALAAGLIVVLFAEGTSSDGSTVLPFRSAMFKAAVQLNQPVSTAHISYVVKGGSVEQDVCYWGRMIFLPHLLRFLCLSNVNARVRFGREAHTFADRKVAATTAREQILLLADSWNAQKELTLSTRV